MAVDPGRKTWVRTSGCRSWRRRPWTGLGRSCRSRQSRRRAPSPAADGRPTRASAGCRAATRFGIGWGQPRGGQSVPQAPTRSGQADADCRYPIRQADRLAADKPKYGTAGVGAGEAVLAAETPCAIWLAAPRHRDHADARSRCRATLCPGPPDRSPRAAWGSSGATMRTAGIEARTAAVDDAIDPVTVDLLRAQIKAEPLAHHTSEEAADRMLLPMGRANDGSNRRSLRSTQHREHASLFRARPAVAPRATFGLRLARMMLLTSGLLCCNRNLLAGGDSFGCRRFDFAGRGRVGPRLLESGRRLIFDFDRFEAGLGDAKRRRSAVVIASPDRERATGADLLQQAGADQLIDNLSGGFAFKVRRQFNSAIVALRSRGQNDELRIGKFRHRDPPLGWCGVVCRHHHSPTLAMQPAGQDPEARLVPGTVTLPLCSRTNASPFWIMLLLVWGRSEHGMIPAASTSLGDSVT